jgi:hypothetical protein
VALLGGRLEIFDLRDVEGMVWSVIGSSKHLYLNTQQRESLATYLVEEVWRCSLRFDSDQCSFSTLAGTVARRRVVDWLRLEFGRSRWQFRGHTSERETPELISLDDLDGDRLDEALATWSGDSETDRDQIDGGVFGDRDRRRARDLELMGLRPRY